MRAVARIVAQLRHALTGVGVVDWFRRPHPDLGGRAPLDVLDDPLALPELVELAGALRATVAT
ncbi:MAG TPA: antitoxin Xre/MbcA/ParS toxin-binding domain-containing protein [Solirubrobacteraceae bacterium]|nr:antitoxin Xre/MbcA/ParS toxin-binding domain-containing protein [Solirubrobacteraceae bacterium]